MDPTQRAFVGRHELVLTQLGFGAAPVGNLTAAVSESDAHAAMATAWQAGLRYFDTSPWYGIGLSEHRVGTFLRGMPRAEYALSTKVGRLLKPWPPRNGPRSHWVPWTEPLDFEVRYDYSYGGIVRSWEDSLQRLGIPDVDILFVHDLDAHYHFPDAVYQARLGELSRSGFDALRDLRADGRIRAVGVGVNSPGTITDMLDRFEVDVFLVAGPYTLMDQGIVDTELARAHDAGCRVIIGAAFHLGLLATGVGGLDPGRRPRFQPEILERACRLEAVCRQFDVPLAAAALQFPAAHPAVSSLLVGAMDANQARQAVEWARTEIPAALWLELKRQRLLSEHAPVPDLTTPNTPFARTGES